MITRPPARAPKVSVIIASFNRSNVLRYAIESVQLQTVSDWEVLVVDDASTDDTQAVVEELDDDRVRYVPLGANFGDQSGPNNVGMLLARAETLAFLNQDDLWFRDHLAHSTGVLDGTGADLVFARCAVARERSAAQLHAGDWSFWTQGAGWRDRYRPGESVPASSWVFRRELARRVGPWRPATEVHGTASADWLFRAWRRGARLRPTGVEGVLVVASGNRSGAYSSRAEEENGYYADQLRRDRQLRARVQDALVEELPPAPFASRRQAADLWIARRFRRARDLVFDRTLAACGVNPMEVRFAYRYRGRGGYIAELRRNRGLDGTRGGSDDE
jgi:glycosyltransferase involved in cell wall biosynthesis